MDIKDQKILKELLINSRIPLSQLSKKVGASREVVDYRVKKLQKKIIRKFNTTINIGALGYQRATCFIKLRKITKKEEEKLMQRLYNHEFVNYFGPVIGTWDLVFDLLIRNDQHLLEITEKILGEIKDNIENHVIILTFGEVGYYNNKLIGAPNMKQKPINKTKMKVDKKDKELLKLLSTNSRIEYTELSKNLGLTPNAIKHRIKQLEKKNVILGYTIELNFQKMGWLLYNIQLKLNTTSIKRLKNFFTEHKRIVYYYHYIGNSNWDVDFGVIVKDATELRGLLLEMRENFGDIIRIYDLYPIIDTLKDEAPAGIFQ